MVINNILESHVTLERRMIYLKLTQIIPLNFIYDPNDRKSRARNLMNKSCRICVELKNCSDIVITQSEYEEQE